MEMFLTIVYLCKTELFEIELFICFKMDLALNNPQMLICHKTQSTNQPIKFLSVCSNIDLYFLDCFNAEEFDNRQY